MSFEEFSPAFGWQFNRLLLAQVFTRELASVLARVSNWKSYRYRAERYPWVKSLVNALLHNFRFRVALSARYCVDGGGEMQHFWWWHSRNF